MSNIGQTKKTKIRLQKKKVKEAIENSGGIISTIANKLGVSWHTVKRYIDKNPDLIELLDAELEKVKDSAEGTLFEEIITHKKSWAIKFFLAYKAKDRGYSTKTDITSNGQTIGQGVVIILPDNHRQRNENEIETDTEI